MNYYEAKFILYTKALNSQGGPGGILLTIDGKPVPANKFKCAKLNVRGQNPEAVYPGSLKNNFDDSAWNSAVVSDSIFYHLRSHAHVNLKLMMTELELYNIGKHLPGRRRLAIAEALFWKVFIFRLYHNCFNEACQFTMK